MFLHGISISIVPKFSTDIDLADSMLNCLTEIIVRYAGTSVENQRHMRNESMYLRNSVMFDFRGELVKPMDSAHCDRQRVNFAYLAKLFRHFWICEQ
ncbi:hypothetical protein SDC9_86366 [bioreactor metagenome]|uniref:Uncharacterized protein n=1 Tax=bioreactor metagenome TaxID=1076179 RepID=A0A644ZFS4_9ZZZZ